MLTSPLQETAAVEEASLAPATTIDLPVRVRLGVRKVRQRPDGIIEYIDDEISWEDWSDMSVQKSVLEQTIDRCEEQALQAVVTKGEG